MDASNAVESKTRAHDDGVSAFMSARPRILAIAHRMLDSAADAEDVLQDVWVRWQQADRSSVRDAPTFLATTATRVAINVLQSARWRRERYAGSRPPEAVDMAANPELGAERVEGLQAALQLLEELTPTERTAYILREAFDHKYRDIADALRLSEVNARRVVTRARERIAKSRSNTLGLSQISSVSGLFVKPRLRERRERWQRLRPAKAVSRRRT